MRHCTQCGSPTPDDARFCPRCGTAVAAGSGDPMLGKVIADRYLLIEKIGQGGSGTIYRGEHNTLRKKVALKILHAQLSTDDTALERFRREATTVAELDNDHILQVVDFGRTEDNRLFFAMEYLEGETLTKVLERDKQLAVPRAIDILTQIAEALMEAHGLGYVHRDLRPRNVFLINKRGRTDFVKLLDFGLAKLVSPTSEAKHTAMGMTFGDPRYMSPEQARGDVLDRRSDIYSLGAIAFEMLTGAPPYSGSGTFEILQQHLDAPVPKVRERRPDVPEWLDAVVQRALSKSRDGRFLTVLKVLECLRSQMAPPAADAAEKAAHAQLTAQGPEPATTQPAPSAKASPQAQTLMGPAPVIGKPASVVETRPLDPIQSIPELGKQEIGKPVAAKVEPKPEAKPEAKIEVKAEEPKPAPQPQPVVAKPSPAASNPAVTQALTTLKPPPPGPATPAAKKTKELKQPRSNQPASSTSGSVDVTPPPRAPEALNVPSVVVESSSQDKTLPERPAPRVESPPPLPTPRPTPQPQPIIEAKGKQDRPPTGEWFSAETKAAGGSGAYDEIEVPRQNRGPLIIGGIVGGLGLALVAMIAFMPKAQHKAVRGEDAMNRALAADKTKPATPPTGATPSPTGVAAAPTGATVAASGAAVAPTGVATAPTGVAVAPTGTTATPTSAPPSDNTPPTAKVADSQPQPIKPAKPEKPAAIAPPVEKPIVAEKKPPKADKPEKPEKLDKSATRVAAVEKTDKPAISDKHKKSTAPDGFKDPFASDAAPAAAPKQETAQAEFFIKLGRQKLNADELSAAAANFNKAREFDARSHEAIAGLGEVAFEQGDYNGAAVHLKQALKISPNRPRYLVLLGQTYYKMGKPKEAVGEYKKALRLDPSNAEAQHSLEVAERKLNGG